MVAKGEVGKSPCPRFEREAGPRGPFGAIAYSIVVIVSRVPGLSFGRLVFAQVSPRFCLSYTIPVRVARLRAEFDSGASPEDLDNGNDPNPNPNARGGAT